MGFLSNLFKAKNKKFPSKKESETIEDYAKRIQEKTGIQVKIKKEDAFENDVYISGKETPVMLLTDLVAGHFINDLDKRIITKPSDISGPIRDSRSGEIVVTAENLFWLVTRN